MGPPPRPPPEFANKRPTFPPPREPAPPAEHRESGEEEEEERFQLSQLPLTPEEIHARQLHPDSTTPMEEEEDDLFDLTPTKRSEETSTPLLVEETETPSHGDEEVPRQASPQEDDIHQGVQKVDKQTDTPFPPPTPDKIVKYIFLSACVPSIYQLVNEQLRATAKLCLSGEEKPSMEQMQAHVLVLYESVLPLLVQHSNQIFAQMHKICRRHRSHTGCHFHSVHVCDFLRFFGGALSPFQLLCTSPSLREGLRQIIEQEPPALLEHEPCSD